MTLVWWSVEKRINLHYAETYWEFTSANPTALVASLHRLLNSFSCHTQSTFHHHDNNHDVDHNAVSLSLRSIPAGRFAKDSIAAERSNEKMQRALHRLREAGVITYNSQPKIYVVTESHRHALQTLKRHGNFSLLIARTRRRSRQGV